MATHSQGERQWRCCSRLSATAIRTQILIYIQRSAFWRIYREIALTATLEYQAALRADPQDSIAAGDLAILDARAGDAKSAVALLAEVSQNDPGETAASMDLAMIECAIGNPQGATMALRHLLEFSPDDQKARQMLASIESKANTCGH